MLVEAMAETLWRFAVGASALWQLALAEETFVGLCESVTEALGLTTPRTAA